jgi:hypothetical protein
MAVKASLRLICQRISKAVRKATAAHGILPGDYALVGTFNERTDRISLTLLTDCSMDDRRLYADIIQEIRRSFPESPEFTMYIGLVIRNGRNLDEVYLDSGGAEDQVDLTGMLEQS